jgi:hypothetical protein
LVELLAAVINEAAANPKEMAAHYSETLLKAAKETANRQGMN